jgi:hypothetical protein
MGFSKRPDKTKSLVLACILQPGIERIGNKNRIRIEERTPRAGELASREIGRATENEFGAGKA